MVGKNTSLMLNQKVVNPKRWFRVRNLPWGKSHPHCILMAYGLRHHNTIQLSLHKFHSTVDLDHFVQLSKSRRLVLQDAVFCPEKRYWLPVDDSIHRILLGLTLNTHSLMGIQLKCNRLGLTDFAQLTLSNFYFDPTHPPLLFLTPGKKSVI